MEVSLLDRIIAFFSAMICGMISFLENVCDFFCRSEVAFVIKGVCVVAAFAFIVATVSGFEAGTVLFSVAIIRIAAALAASITIFKVLG